MKDLNNLLVFWSMYIEVKHRLGDDFVIEYILDTMAALRELKKLKGKE